MDQYQNPGSEKSMYPQVSYGTNPNAPPYNQPPPQPTNNFVPPQQQVSMTTVVVTQPQQVKNDMMVASLQGHRDWSTGLFECFQDIGVCLFTWCCYPCAVCMLASRTGECFCTPACVPASDITLRTRIRTLGGIQGSMCNDCMVVACCGPCAACQESRELTNMGVP